MKAMEVYVVAGSILGLAAFGSTVANAADFNGSLRVRHAPLSVHSEHTALLAPAGCGWKCRGGCLDRYSCYSLYGAYGPYGGTAYWARYTISGWGFHR
jgi:hypothetical protein